VVSAGLNSNVSNALNWLQKDCGTMLFADFETNYTCSNAQTTFTDKSAGAITSWSWNFGDANSGENTTSTQNPIHTFTLPENYTVTLTVGDGSSISSYSKQINIKNNDLPLNMIVVNGNTLLSFYQASGYQWYKNGMAIDGAISRTFNYNGDAGNYSVVINDGGACNVSSLSYVITELQASDKGIGIQIYPNPVQHDILMLKGKGQRSAKVVLYNNLGQPVMLSEFVDQEMNLDLKNLPDGLYHIEIQSTTIYRKKIIIKR
jgi:PKD repeat protein